LSSRRNRKSRIENSPSPRPIKPKTAIKETRRNIELKEEEKSAKRISPLNQHLKAEDIIKSQYVNDADISPKGKKKKVF